MDLQTLSDEYGIDRNGVRTLLVPTDFSKYSDAALQAAIDIAQQQKARIYLLYVIPMNEIGFHWFHGPATRDPEERVVHSLRDMIRKQVDRFPQAESIEIIPDIRKGITYEEILREEKEKKVDLIVMGPQGRPGLLHHPRGRVLERVIGFAQSSVMVVGT
jgi:universal stress protein A